MKIGSMVRRKERKIPEGHDKTTCKCNVCAEVGIVVTENVPNKNATFRVGVLWKSGKIEAMTTESLEENIYEDR